MATTMNDKSQNESAKLLNQVVMLTEANEQKAVLETECSTLAETTKALEDRIAEMDASDERRAEELAVSYHTMISAYHY